MSIDAELIRRSVSEDGRWLPYGIRHDGTRLLVDLCNVADDGLEEPFFDQSIHRILRQNPGASRSIPVEALEELTSYGAAAGFIFHISRCGSTLVSQMLASIRQSAVFSEPAIIETLLRGSHSQCETSNESKTWLLKNVIRAFVGNNAGTRSTLIKFAARATLDHPLICQAHPAVPCILMYREPVEVLVSLAGNQGDRLPPGLSEAGLLRESPLAIKAMRPVEFWVRVLANQYAAALAMCECSHALLVNYTQIPAIAWTDIANFFGLELSASDVESMQESLKLNAKNPHRHFNDDRAAKRGAATQEIHALVDGLVRPYYDRLESIRAKAIGWASEP
jgi:hypothetical protein